MHLIRRPSVNDHQFGIDDAVHVVAIEFDDIPFVDADDARSVPFSGEDHAAHSDDWQALGRDYLHYLEQHFPADCIVLDKRPDNFLYLPMLLRLFPRARVLHTSRQPLDNCLSVYFQQLGSGFHYANRLSDIAHYLQGEQDFVARLAQGSPRRIHDVSYESLVADARDALGDVLGFLGLPWEDACLAFAGRDTRVRTASVSQVRQELYRSSVGRWRNYEQELEELVEQFSAAD